VTDQNRAPDHAGGGGGAHEDDPTAVRFVDKRRIDPATGEVRRPGPADGKK